MAIRQRLRSLGELLGPEAVLRMCRATMEDLDLIAVIEDTKKEVQEDNG